MAFLESVDILPGPPYFKSLFEGLILSLGLG